ncbi:MAG: hypothetical protein BWX60_00803 [Candidatus Marinimicrobia bacterium ADurb.Bin030]|nr:MAG: hypothetical protein BWX60_00803 [Candidatus Marinimicrobia bacterium ADurb.Bin030]
MRSNITDTANVAIIGTFLKTFRQFQNGAFTHTVSDKISFGIEKNRAANGVTPVIIMRYPSEASFDAAQHDRFGFFKMLTNEIGVNNYRPIRTAVVNSAGSIIVMAAFFQRSGVIGNHRINRTTGHAPEETRFAEAHNVVRNIQGGLGNDTDSITSFK